MNDGEKKENATAYVTEKKESATAYVTGKKDALVWRIAYT